MVFGLFRAAGEVLGDVFEVSRIRREDYEFHKGKSEYEDILQCNNLPSSATPRGHQTPAAFLIMASGLDKVLTHCQNKLLFSCKCEKQNMEEVLWLTCTIPFISNAAWCGLWHTSAILPHWHCWIQWSFPRCPNRSPNPRHGNQLHPAWRSLSGYPQYKETAVSVLHGNTHL